MIVNIYDLLNVYENIIVPKVKNKNIIKIFELKKMMYLYEIKYVLENNLYKPNKYHIFIIKDPKIRMIMNQHIFDKIINHYVTNYVLIPKLSKYLIDENTATRKNMGTSYTLRKLKCDIEKHKKYNKFYFLKFDLSKYFYNIDHIVLKNLIKKDLTTLEFELVSKIIDSTNESYINENIKILEKKHNISLPKYNFGKGLQIGLMSSHFLAILYLYKLHHYIKHNLKIKCFTIYMDDYILLHHGKAYLNKCLKIINDKLYNEYKLSLNINKTYIKSSKEGIDFLGYIFKIYNNKTIVKLSSKTKRKIIKKIKENDYKFKNNIISFSKHYASIQNYKYSYTFVKNNQIKYLLEKYLN